VIKRERREERQGQRARMDIVDEKEKRVEIVWRKKRKVEEWFKKNTEVMRELMERKA
jgi:hypothetical protein